MTAPFFFPRNFNFKEESSYQTLCPPSVSNIVCTRSLRIDKALALQVLVLVVVVVLMQML